MDGTEDRDFISDMPDGIIANILTCLPIRDAIRTCVLSKKWKSKWNLLRELVFDDECIDTDNDPALVHNCLLKFISLTLFLHREPIHKLQIITDFLQSCPEIDFWFRFLSSVDIRELIFEVGLGLCLIAPSFLFDCRKLTSLSLCRFQFNPPPNFEGFLCLKTLNLHYVLVFPETIESFISSCPLLEHLSLSCLHVLILKINAPKLKYLCLEGEYKEIRLESTPLLETVSVSLYMTEENPVRFKRSSGCNLIEFMSSVPLLKKISGHSYFPEYLSTGDYPSNLSVTYDSLKVVDLHEVHFERMKQILVVLRLITNAPNLEELQVSGTTDPEAAMEAPDLDYWEKDYPKNCTFRHLKVANMLEMSGVPHEMEFFRFLLARSPVLETMTVAPGFYGWDGGIDVPVELLTFPRASAVAKIFYKQA